MKKVIIASLLFVVLGTIAVGSIYAMDEKTLKSENEDIPTDKITMKELMENGDNYSHMNGNENTHMSDKNHDEMMSDEDHDEMMNGEDSEHCNE